MHPHMSSQQTLPPYPQQYNYSTQEGQLAETPAQPQTIPESTQSQTTPESVQPQTPASIQVVPSPIFESNGKNALDSSVIDKSQLPLTTAEALQKYHGLLTESKASTLAWKLAKDCVFGEKVLRECTPLGNRELPALPQVELGDLKKLIFKQFPQYWRSPSDFENLWKKCVESIQQGCKRLRLARK
uniref:BEN domain-containing protein n=1 Tax=Amphimedon queenslandica TaxID=400682 RepID=A0A1X7U3M4_AMPQE